MSVQNFSFLARLEVAEKFVVVMLHRLCGGGDVAQAMWWSRPSLGFSFSQAEQYQICLCWGEKLSMFLCNSFCCQKQTDFILYFLPEYVTFCYMKPS